MQFNEICIGNHAMASTIREYNCSYFHLVLLLKQNLVLFVFSSSSSRAISVHVCV